MERRQGLDMVCFFLGGKQLIGILAFGSFHLVKRMAVDRRPSSDDCPQPQKIPESGTAARCSQKRGRRSVTESFDFYLGQFTTVVECCSSMSHLAIPQIHHGQTVLTITDSCTSCLATLLSVAREDNCGVKVFRCDQKAYSLTALSRIDQTKAKDL